MSTICASLNLSRKVHVSVFVNEHSSGLFQGGSPRWKTIKMSVYSQFFIRTYKIGYGEKLRMSVRSLFHQMLLNGKNAK